MAAKTAKGRTDNKPTIFVRFERETYAAVKRLAKDNHRTFGGQVSYMVERQLEKETA